MRRSNFSAMQGATNRRVPAVRKVCCDAAVLENCKHHGVVLKLNGYNALTGF